LADRLSADRFLAAERLPFCTCRRAFRALFRQVSTTAKNDAGRGKTHDGHVGIGSSFPENAGMGFDTAAGFWKNVAICRRAISAISPGGADFCAIKIPHLFRRKFAKINFCYAVGPASNAVIVAIRGYWFPIEYADLSYSKRIADILHG
jgi:hypothetical protein